MTPTFGASLREARERKGISLRQIASVTKISVAALESLERNDFSRLPGGIFSRAFVRSYAVEVGLDPDETVQRFLDEYDGDLHPDTRADEQPATAAETHTMRRPAVPLRASSTDNTSREFEFESRQRIASVVLKLVAVSVPVAAAILYFSSRGSAPVYTTETSGPSVRPVAEEQATPAAPPVQPAVTRERAPRAETRQVAKTEPASPAAVDGGITLELAPSGDCWAQLTTDGAVVVSRVLKAGEHETRAFRDLAVLQVGDAAACALSINGRPARPLGAPRKVRQITITPQNYTSFLQ